MPPDALSGQKMIVATAICKDSINYAQMFESTRAKICGRTGRRES
jgi:hypothetical protein